MPPEQPITDDIADEAVRWFADRDSGLADEAALRVWLDADPRHAAAFAQMEALWSDMAHVPASPAVRTSLSPPSFRPSINPWLPTALAASIMLMMIGWAYDWPTRLRADAMTATGEQRTVALPDGSHILLNTHSAIALDYSGDRRVVRLLTGEAAFTVSPDRHRPFIVEARGGTTTALGTKFLLREDGGTVRVSVTQHRVRVAYRQDRSSSVEVGEGQGVTYGPSQGLASPARVNDADAWTQGLLIFEDRPLSEVVAELGRYHPGYIRLIGSDVQNRRVSGLFNINDPVGAVLKLQRSLGLRSTQFTNRLIFIFA